MEYQLKIIPNTLLASFQSNIDFDLTKAIATKSLEKIPFDYFNFYNSISAVYSSKIEGENVEVDSYIKHRFLKVKYEPDYTKKADDLAAAYEFIQTKKLGKKNVLKAHSILSRHLLAKSQRGKIRANPMFVLNEEDRIEYVACEPHKVKEEWDKLFQDVKVLLKAELTIAETFYYAAFIHLIFLKIHPLQDGNGRTARLIEKWFLLRKLGKKAIAIELEKYYYQHKTAYYNNIRVLGLDYELLNYNKAMNFLLMTVTSMNQ